MIKVSVFYDGNSIREFEQSDEKEISIGRASGCSIHLDEPSISRLHAVLRFDSGSWILERKANFGAVLLNGQEVENAPLEGGEEIAIGQFVLRVQIEGAEVGGFSMGGGSSVYTEDDGKTKFVSSGVNALFRFEPGSANVSEFLMDKDTAIFGRGSNCDVILTEKKASRKHCEIRKQGLSFFLKDLNSANGTLVNGNSIQEVELVPGDLIQIGDSKFQFTIENKDYFNRQDQFMPVPAQLEDSGADPGQLPAYSDPMSAIGGVGEHGYSDPNNAVPGLAPSTEEEPKSLVGKLRKRYMAMTFRQRLIFIGVFFAFLVAILGGDDQDKGKKTPSKTKQGRSIRTFELLTKDKKAIVLQNYNELLKAHEKRDFQRMQIHAANILTHVDDYKDTKYYESVAKKGLEAIAEEERAKRQREEQEKLRREVAALEAKGQALFEKALDQARYRSELKALVQDIYSKDPNNKSAQEWLTRIAQKEEEEKAAAENARQLEELRERAEAAFAAVEATFKKEKYIQALAEADKLNDVGYTDQSYLDRIEDLKNRIREKLESVIGPLLREAANQKQEGGDLVKAKELFLEVLKVDATNKEARSGLDSIRETLHMRAKRLYAEAILAESVSDLVEAKEKYEKCLRMAPDDDIYKKRCRGKLARFDSFN